MAWVIVYLSALSEAAVSLLVKSDVVHLLVEKLAASESLQLLIPVNEIEFFCPKLNFSLVGCFYLQLLKWLQFFSLIDDYCIYAGASHLRQSSSC